MNLASTTPLLLTLFVLLVIVAFSSGTEVAMLSVNRYRIRHRAEGGSGTARILERLLQKPDDWLGANLVILAAASVFASAIATILAQRTGYRYAVPLAGVVLTIVVIVFCELAPKIYAAANPEARRAARGRHLPRAGAGGAPGAVAHQQRSPTASCGCSASARGARRPGAEHRGAAHRGDRGRAADPGAPPPDAAVDPRPRAASR